MKRIKANKSKHLLAAHILLTVYSTCLFMCRIQRSYSLLMRHPALQYRMMKVPSP